MLRKLYMARFQKKKKRVQWPVLVGLVNDPIQCHLSPEFLNYLQTPGHSDCIQKDVPRQIPSAQATYLTYQPLAHRQQRANMGIACTVHSSSPPSSPRLPLVHCQHSPFPATLTQQKHAKINAPLKDSKTTGLVFKDPAFSLRPADCVG